VGAKAQHLVGLIHCRKGDPAEGVRHLRAAVAAEPANVAFQVMLARALIDSGRAADVLAMPFSGPGNAVTALWQVRAEAADAAGDAAARIEAWGAVTQARPDEWRAWGNLGNAHQSAEDWPQAAAAFRKAVDLNPGDAGLRRNLAWALAVAGDLSASAEQLRAAVRIEPSHLPTLISFARNLADLDRHNEALAAWDAAEVVARARPDAGAERLQIAVGRGRLFVAMTRFEDAERTYRAALADHPRDPDALSELGLLLERTGRMDELKTFLEGTVEAGFGKDAFGYLWAVLALRDRRPDDALALLLAQDSDFDPIRWHALRARIEDALGNSEAAFEAAGAMHHAMHDVDSWKRKGERYRRQIRSLLPHLTPEWAARLPALTPGKRRTPAFLVGFPRSGTTLLDTFLMGHPNVVVLEEVHMLGAAERVAGRLAELPERSPGLLAEARSAYFAELDRHVDPDFGGVVVDKLPLNMIGAPLIHALFPDANVIFAQRHPCDAVLSGFMQSFVLNDAMASFLEIEDAADLYDAAMSAWSTSAELLPINSHVLVYEELVDHPQSALAPLVETLGLGWDEQMLDHRSTAKARGAIITPSYNQVTQPLSKAPVGRWRRYQAQLAPVLPVLLPWATRLGYSD
jgi:tetratricopeptide (TPR) repeat protein